MGEADTAVPIVRGLSEMTRRVRLFDLPLDIDASEDDVIAGLASGKLLLTYLNPLAYRVSMKVSHYAENLEKFDLVVCDGVGIQRAAKHLFGSTPTVLTPDYSGIAAAYLGFGSQRGWSICLVGGVGETSKMAAQAIEAKFAGFSNVLSFEGYGEGPSLAKEFITESGTDMVLVGMGMGRQEDWLLDLVSGNWKGVGICVGGFLDKLANPRLDYPIWSERIGMRFLGRFTQEPARMAKRYLIDYQPFLRQYCKSLVIRS